LAPAVELEDALLELSRNLSSKGLPTAIHSSSDLDAIIPHIKSTINDLRLYEYYVFATQANVKSVSTALEGKDSKAWTGQNLTNQSVETLAQIAKDTPGLLQNYRAWSGRYCSTSDAAVAAGFIEAAYPGGEAGELAGRWGKVLDVINVDLYRECNEDVEAAIDGVIGRLRFNRLEDGGPKLGAVTEESAHSGFTRNRS
jgi:glycogen debranching enzyme